MVTNQILDGFETYETGVRINTSHDIGLMLFYKPEWQKKGFIKLYMKEYTPEFIEQKFGGEKGLEKEAGELFEEENFEKTFELIVRALANQSASLKETSLNIIEKTFIFR